MKNAEKFFAPLLALLLALSLAGCAGEGPAAPRGAPHRLCFVAKSTDTEFWQAAFAGARAASSEYNAELTICGPETEEDYETQNEYIAEAVKNGAEALIFSAISYTENAPAIDAAAAAGVKIVVIDSDVDSQRVSARIGTDNVQAGRMAAAAAMDADYDTLTVGIVNYDLGSRNGQEREQGFREALEKDPRTGEIYTINVLTTPEAAMAGAVKLLAEHPEINVLAAFNEPLAVGAAMAVDALGLAGKIRMVGFDTNVKCIDLMRAGAVSALIVQNPYAMGYLGVETAWQLLEGGEETEGWLDTATTMIDPGNMFSPESQKALFPFG